MITSVEGKLEVKLQVCIPLSHTHAVILSHSLFLSHTFTFNKPLQPRASSKSDGEAEEEQHMPEEEEDDEESSGLISTDED